MKADRPTPEREAALRAIQLAAARLALRPEELRATQYRSVRLSRGSRRLPSEPAIREAFGGWERARERAASRDA